jgi:hypothetical protein
MPFQSRMTLSKDRVQFRGLQRRNARNLLAERPVLFRLSTLNIARVSSFAVSVTLAKKASWRSFENYALTGFTAQRYLRRYVQNEEVFRNVLCETIARVFDFNHLLDTKFARILIGSFCRIVYQDRHFWKYDFSDFW